jgi:hypothetical protein
MLEEKNFHFEINVPTLKRLRFSIAMVKYELKLNASNLQYFCFRSVLEEINFGRLPNLKEAYIDIDSSRRRDLLNYGNKLCDFLHALGIVKSLH